MFFLIIMAFIMAWKFERTFQWLVLAPLLGTCLGAFVWAIACMVTSTFLDMRTLGVLIIVGIAAVGVSTRAE